MYKDISFIEIAKIGNNLIRDYLILQLLNKVYNIYTREYFMVKKEKWATHTAICNEIKQQDTGNNVDYYSIIEKHIHIHTQNIWNDYLI